MQFPPVLGASGSPPSGPAPDDASPATVARQCPMRVASASPTSPSSLTAASSGPRAHLRALGHRPRSLVPLRIPRDGTWCPPPTRSHPPARAVPSASMVTDGDAPETQPRVVHVWIKSDEDGRVASGARVWERPLPASPYVSLVPGADGTPSDPDASAFDHAAYFDALKTRVYGRTLMTAGTLPSTQTLVQDNSSAHPGSLPRGVACVADTQSGGRGRGGNQWTSPPGCLMFSLLARHPDGRTLPFIQYVATMAAVDAIQEAADQALVDAGVAGAGFRRGTGRTVDVRVKWPNDLYCGDAKIGGVLCASTYDDGGFDVVVGVGINLDNAEPTTCVNRIIAERVARARDSSSSSTSPSSPPTPLTRERLMASFANRFEALAGMLNAAGGFEPLEEAYLRQWLHTDQVVTLEEEGGARPRLTVKGITKTGYLLAVDAAGARYELHPDGNSFDFFKGLVRKKMQS